MPLFLCSLALPFPSYLLCLADLMACVFFQIMLSDDNKDFLTNNLCIFTVYVQMAFYHSSSLWVCMIGVHLWRAVKGKKQLNERIYHCICWDIPFLYLIVPIGLRQVGYTTRTKCFLEGYLTIVVFYDLPRMLFCGCVFVTVCLVLLEVEKLRKAFSWSNCKSQKYTSRRRLFLIQLWFIPCAIATFISLFVPYESWPFMVTLYINTFQGLANVLSTGERKIILSTRKLFKKIFKRMRTNPTMLSHLTSSTVGTAQTDLTTTDPSPPRSAGTPIVVQRGDSIVLKD